MSDMNALELAECIEDYGLTFAESATMLRRQHEAIKQLREALITHQKAGVGNSTDYKTQHAAYMGAHKALADTEEFK